MPHPSIKQITASVRLDMHQFLQVKMAHLDLQRKAPDYFNRLVDQHTEFYGGFIEYLEKPTYFLDKTVPLIRRDESKLILVGTRYEWQNRDFKFAKLNQLRSLTEFYAPMYGCDLDEKLHELCPNTSAFFRYATPFLSAVLAEWRTVKNRAQIDVTNAIVDYSAMLQKRYESKQYSKV